jgi:hypothetical protein
MVNEYKRLPEDSSSNQAKIAFVTKNNTEGPSRQPKPV